MINSISLFDYIILLFISEFTCTDTNKAKKD